MNIIRQLFSKISLSALVALLAAVFSYRAGSHRQQLDQEKEKAHEFETILQDVEQAQRISNDVDAMPDDAVSRELHANDWYRD